MKFCQNHWSLLDIRLPDLIADERRRRTLAVGAILSYLGPADLTKIADGKEVGLLRRNF
jgi:hypothetical protein